VIESLGPLAPLFFLLLGIGLPVQFALGGAVALGRRIPASATLLVPALLLSLGGFGMGLGLFTSTAAIQDAGDPAWVPWFALQDRATACVPGLTGAVGGLLCVLPVLTGAAARVLPATKRSYWPLGVGGATTGVVLVGVLLQGGLRSAAEAGALAVVVLGAALACVEASPRSQSSALIALGSLVLGGASLALAHVLGLHVLLLRALPNFDVPFAALPAVEATMAQAAAGSMALVPWVLLAWITALPAILARTTAGTATGAPKTEGRDAIGMVLLVMLPLTAWGWGGLQWNLHARRAGAHAAAVLTEGAQPVIPLQNPLPPRVLRVLPKGSRWQEMGETGGTRVRIEPTAMDALGPLLHLGDGLVFPAAMTMDDVYFTFDGADAGFVQLVSCTVGAGTSALAEAIRSDPLRANGRCGAAPIFLRVTRDLSAPLRIIVLKDGLVDDDGDIYPVQQVGQHHDLSGKDVILRAQLDATVSDFANALGVLRSASRIYLGWGVSTDGSDLPIGVNPGLRVHVPVHAAQ